MKILFIQKDVFAKPGIMSLSAVVKQIGHECDLVIEDLEKNIKEKVMEINPDIIAFSITTGEYPWMNRAGKEIRKYFKKTIICGGPHPTFYPETIHEEYLDAICIGEGEESLVDFVNALASGQDVTSIKNFHIKKDTQTYENELRPLIADLDSLPFMDRSLYTKYSIFRSSPGSILCHHVVVTSRGCPYQCSYCFNKAFNQLYRGKGQIVRRRSVTNVIEELSLLKQDRTFKFVAFEDDSFALPPREWIETFFERYRNEINIPFRILTPANLIDEGLMAGLKKANCYSFKMGVESGNEDFRKNTLQKKVSDSDIIQAAQLAKKYGIRFQTFNIAGCPGETLDMVLQTYELNKRIKPDFIWCSLCNPYPKTDIFDYAKEYGCIDDSFDYRNIGYTLFFDMPMNIKNKREISNLQKIMALGVLTQMPGGLISFLIRLPLTPLYSALFGLTFLIGVYRTSNTSLYSLIKLSLFRLYRYIKWT